MTTYLPEWTSEDSDALDVEILITYRRNTAPRVGKIPSDQRRLMAAAADVLAGKGLPLDEIADHLGVNDRTVSRWRKAQTERGDVA